MKYVIRLLYLLVFIASMALIVTGQQRKIGWQSFLVATMLVGLLGILLLLYLYNKNINNLIHYTCYKEVSHNEYRKYRQAHPAYRCGHG